MKNTILISALLLAQSFAITPRRRARVDVPKAPKLKKELAATKKQKSVTPTDGEDHENATTGVEARRGRGGDRRGLLGRGQDAKVGDSDIID